MNDVAIMENNWRCGACGLVQPDSYDSGCDGCGISDRLAPMSRDMSAGEIRLWQDAKDRADEDGGMSIPVDGRAKTFGYLSEAEQAAWDHGVFQGQLDRELEAWADGVLERSGPFGGETGGEACRVYDDHDWQCCLQASGAVLGEGFSAEYMDGNHTCGDPWAEVKP